MTTTTLGTNDTIVSRSNKTIYWAGAAAVVIAFILAVAYVNRNTINNTAPTSNTESFRPTTESK